MNLNRLETISAAECCIVCGGVDKNAQSALYYIGFAIGFIIRCIARLFGNTEPQVGTAM